MIRSCLKIYHKRCDFVVHLVASLMVEVSMTMKRDIKLVFLTIIVMSIWHCTLHSQTESEYALIRLPVFQNPPIWKITRSVTNTYWNIDLFSSPRSAAQSYIMTPSYDLWSGVSFHLDHAWNRIVYFEALDSWIRAYSSYGTGTCQFWWPKSLDALAPCNDVGFSIYYYIYVADTENDRIVKLQYDWPSQNMICNSPIMGGGLDRPGDLDLNNGGTFWPSTDDYLWVLNVLNSRPSQIKRFTIDGVLRSTFGDYGCDSVAGYFCHLTAIVSGRSDLLSDPYDPYANNDHFYVADRGNNWIVWLIKLHNGETISWMTSTSTSSSIVDLEVDNFGQLWAVDRDAGMITKYTYDLFPLCTFGSSGTGENQFWQPISISNTGGYLASANMYVLESWSDSSGGQYFTIGTDVVDFEVISTQNERWHYINYVLVDPSDVSVKIYNLLGQLVKTLFDGGQFSGPASFVWDGTNDLDEKQATGDYRVVLVDTCTYWNVDTQTPVNVVTKEAWFHHVYNPLCCVQRGDVDHSGGAPNIADLTYLVDFLMRGGPDPPCMEEGDVNGSGGPPNIADLTFLVDYLMRGGGDPPPCP